MRVPTAPLINSSATMMSKRESRSESGNTERKARWRDKIRGKHKDTSAVETDPQPSACDEGSKPQTSTQVPLESNDPGHSEDRRDSLPQGNDDHYHDVSQSEDLWERAYQALKTRDPGLVTDYELSLAALNDPQTDCAQMSLPELIDTVVKKKLGDREKKQLVIHLREKPIKVREQGEKVIRFILWSNNFISTALSAQPYAALAWSGVSILLPLFLNSSQQSKDMVDGLDSICDLLELYNLKELIYLRHRDSTAHQDCVKAVEELYTDIFEYQAQLIRYLSKSSIKRAARGTFQLDKWNELLEKVKESDIQCTKHFKLMSVEKEQEFYSQNLSSWKQSFEIYECMLKMAESSQVRERLNRQDDHETALLRALSPPEADYKRDKNVISERVAGTCKWFFEDERFLNWRNSKSSELLWVSAGPGCGKSVLVKALIDERRVCTNVMASTVCYFFFKDGLNKRMDGASALCAILHQLFRNTTNLITHGLPTHRSYGDGLQTKFSELWEILINASKDPEAGEIVCILDALDECERNEREKLISELVRFFSGTETHQNRSFPLKFLVTSRHYDDIEGNFEPLLNVSTFVRFDGNDKSHVIADEINLVIDAKLPKIATHFNAKDRESIRERLKKMENRTYLWLFLTIDIITGSRSKYGKISSIDKVLSNLPPKVSDAYERILDRSSDEDLARVLLQLIVAATRPLSLKEANVALTLATQEPPAGSYKELDLWPLSRFESIVQDICGLFVSVHDGKLSLIHQTAREFLLVTNDLHSVDSGKSDKWQGCLDITEAHGTMSRVCLAYLNFDDLASVDVSQWKDESHGKNGPQGEDGPQSEAESLRLFYYAANNWPGHYNLQSSELAKDSRRAAQTLCNRGTSEGQWFHLYYAKRKLSYEKVPRCTGLVIASLFGLSYVVQDLLNEGAEVDAQNASFGNALYAASRRGHFQVVRILLENGADINAPNACFRNALYAASRHGHYQVVRILLEEGADVNTQDGSWGNALVAASSKGHYQVVQLLLEEGADVNAQDGSWGSALLAASFNGHYQVVQLLLEHGADINAQNACFYNALHAASEHGHYQVVRILLEEGADVNAQGGRWSSTLIAASSKGHYQVVQLLLENGADVNAQAGHFGNALMAALSHCHYHIVLMLLKNGFDLESANLDPYELRKLRRVLERWTNFYHADLSKYLQKVQELLEKAIFDAQDGESTSSAESVDVQDGEPILPGESIDFQDGESTSSAESIDVQDEESTSSTESSLASG